MSDNNFMNNSNLKKIGVNLSYTKEQVLEIQKCSEDPVYFIDNYCYIVTLDYGIQQFKLYDCQKKKIETIHDNRRIIIMESRQAGKCFTGDTKYKIRNKKTGEILYVTAEEFHEKFGKQNLPKVSY